MKTRLYCLGAALAISLGSARALRAQDPAEAAWTRGDYPTAESLYRQKLAVDSNDVTALHRLALITGWAKRYDESLAFFHRLRRQAPDDEAIALEQARVLAWKRDFPAAMAAVDSILARDPGNVEMLRAKAQFATWGGDFRTALPLWDRLLALDPAHRKEILLGKADALLWSGKRAQAAHAFEDLLAIDPGQAEARLGLARSYSYGGAQDTARAVYQAVLRQDPRNIEALRGLAQTYAWSGKLRHAEAAWHRALGVAPEDVPSLVGLAQTLRWQGRAAEALSILDRARRLAPDDPDVQTQIAWAEAAAGPRAYASNNYEHDSDGNRINTSRLVLRWNPGAHVEISADGYRKKLLLDAPGLDHSTYGGLLTLTGFVGGGWSLSAGGGAATVAQDNRWIARYAGAIHTPAGRPVMAGLGYQRSLFDYTALLADNSITYQELALSIETAPTAPWAATLRTAGALFDGAEQNQRLLVRGTLTRSVASQLRAGVALTGFGFEKRLSEGYFSPNFYGLAELTLNWTRNSNAWRTVLEVAPGIQQIERDGALQGAYRGQATVAYTIAPGAQIGLTGYYAANALQRWGVNANGYRYWSLGITGGLAF